MKRAGDAGGRATAGLAILALLASCFNSRVPPGAQLACTADDDCPEGLVCKATVRLCIDPLGDTVSPALEGTPEVSPLVAGTGVPVTVSFRVSELLGADPKVLVGEVGEARPDEDGTSRAERRYRYLLVPAGTEPQNVPTPVTITLLDRAGNEASRLVAGSVSFDFAAPKVAGEPQVKLEGPPKALVDPVEKAGVGARVSVAFGFDEPAGVEPVVRAVYALADPETPGPDEVLAFVRASGGPTSYVFEHVLEDNPGRPDGQYALLVEVRDVAGNEARYTLGAGFAVDTVAPSVPDVATEGRVVFRREPWGTEAGAGVPRMQVKVLEGGVEPGASLFVLSHGLHGELGHAVAGAKGAATVDLFYADLPRVYVRAVDGAGNASAEAPVRDLEWVATMGGKVAGSTRENPHLFVSRTKMGRSVSGQVGPLYGSKPHGGAALARVDASGGAGAVRSTGEPTWAQRDPRVLPVWGCAVGDYAVGGALMVRDVARDQVVMLSGDGLTWVFNGDDFRPVTPQDPEGDGDPSPRCGGALVYDERRGEVVLMGGMGAVGETWVWNGSSWRQAAINDGPTPRTHASVGYDKLREEVVFFSGSPAFGGRKPDTWTWDGTRWHERTPAHSPPPRYGGHMAWDPAGATLLMFGGMVGDDGSSDTEGGDLWRWDGSDWAEIVPASSTDPWPNRRYMGMMLLDTARGRPVLFGGAQPKSKAYDFKIWDWDGARWTGRDGSTPTPLDMRSDPRYLLLKLYSGRGLSSVYYDEVRRRVVLYGGGTEYPIAGPTHGFVEYDDRWDLDPATGTWTDRTPPKDPATGVAFMPTTRLAAAMAYDESRRHAVLFGGSGGLDESTVFADLKSDQWTWDGTAWTKVPPAATWPGDRAVHAMAYDASRGVTLMFGGWGSSGDTWELADGWTYKGASASLTGQPYAGVAMAPFEQGGTTSVVRFGGIGLVLSPSYEPWAVHSQETAVWGGAAWAIPSPAAKPAPRLVAAMGPDGQGGLILFGGEVTTQYNPESYPFKGARRNDTWRWDGTNWTQLLPHDPSVSPTVRPEPRLGQTMVYDPERGRLVMADGYGTGAISDLWDWDPDKKDWLRRWPSNPDGGKVPLPAMERAAAYDTVRKKMLFFGGQSSTKTLDEFWELDAGVGERPGHLFSVALADSGFPAEAALTRVTATAVAGGRAPSGDGVELWGWLPEGWQVLASDPAAAPDALGAVGAQVDDPARLARITFQEGLHFAVVPEGTNAATPAEVATDYVEVVVRARLP